MITKERFFSSAVMIGLSIFAVMNAWACLAVAVGLTVLALYEFFHLIKKKGIPTYHYTGIIIGALLPFAAFFSFAPTKGGELLFIITATLIIVFMQMLRDDNTDAIVGISTTLFGVLYVGWFFSYLIKIRSVMPEVPWAGAKLLAFILLITKCGDMGALIIGKRWGKTPLLPKISPNKTVEGAMGSFAASGLAAFLSQGLIPESFHFSTMHIICMGLFFGFLGQIGDLSESLIKRDLQVKDSGNMLPALGGALDAIDSLLFTAPAFYFYINSIIL